MAWATLIFTSVAAVAAVVGVLYQWRRGRARLRIVAFSAQTNAAADRMEIRLRIKNTGYTFVRIEEIGLAGRFVRWRPSIRVSDLDPLGYPRRVGDGFPKPSIAHDPPRPDEHGNPMPAVLGPGQALSVEFSIARSHAAKPAVRRVVERAKSVYAASDDKCIACVRIPKGIQQSFSGWLQGV